MFILLFVILVIMMVATYLISKKASPYDNTLRDVIMVFIGIIMLVVVIVTLFTVGDLVELSVIDEKIAMYESENVSIESKMNDLVKNYMQYENDTLKSFASESSITLITLYPDLKSDQLIQKQLETYINNNETIKLLKLQKINNTKAKWWLYFGS